MPVVQLKPAVSVKKYPEDRKVITREEVLRDLVRNEKHIHRLIKDLDGISRLSPHAAYGILSDMFQYLENYRLYEIAATHQGKLFYHERNLRNLYRSREDMRYHHQELWENSRRYPALVGLSLSDMRACLEAEPTADRFLNYLRTAVNRMARHVAQLIKESSDSKTPHYQYNAFVDCLTGVRVADTNQLLNPVFSEQYFGLLPEGANRRVYIEAVRLTRRYGAVRSIMETNSLVELVDYSKAVCALLPELDYEVLRTQYAELMHQRSTPTAATYNFYDYEKRHFDHYDGRGIALPGPGDELKALALRRDSIDQPLLKEAAFYLAVGRETNHLIQRLVESMERIRSFSMLQTTYERLHQSDQEEGLTVEEDS